MTSDAPTVKAFVQARLPARSPRELESIWKAAQDHFYPRKHVSWNYVQKIEREWNAAAGERDER